MDYKRRKRRGGHRPPHIRTDQMSADLNRSSSWYSFLGTCYGIITITCLISIFYFLMEYHCARCLRKSEEMHNLHSTVVDIAKNLSIIKDNYGNLEVQIMRVSQELPRIEGQLDILETLTNSLDSKYSNKYSEWDPRVEERLPYVDVFLTQQMNRKNASCNTSIDTKLKNSPKSVQINNWTHLECFRQ